MKTEQTLSTFLKENLKEGEQYAGTILGKEGQLNYHLVLLPGEAEGLTWDKAVEFSQLVGGELPTRREQSLLFANLPEQFQPRWYWSGEPHASYPVCAWLQVFDNGTQGSSCKSYKHRARAVRRVPTLGD